MVNIVIFGILILPWIFVPVNGISDQLRYPKAVGFDLICMAIICWSLIKGLKFTYRNKYLSWLCIWIFITYFFNWYIPKMMSPNGTMQFNIWTIDSFIHFILGLFAFNILASSLEGLDYVEIAKYICLNSVLITLYAILQINGFDPMRNMIIYKVHEHYHFSALVDHPDTIGNYLAMSLPFFLFFKQNKYKLGFLIVLSGVLLSKSSLSISAMIISLLLYIFIRYQNLKYLLYSLAGFITFIIFSLITPNFNKISNGFTGRIDCWKQIIEHIKNNPLFGQGIGVIQTWNITTGSEVFDNVRQVYAGKMLWVTSHNSYLDIISYLGFFGLALFLMVVLHSLRNFNYKSNNIIGFSYYCSFISFLIIMGASFPMEIAPICFLSLIGFLGTEKIS